MARQLEFRESLALSSSKWTISPAQPHDAPRLAQLQISAFESNEQFKISFPTQQIVEAYHTHLTQRIKDEIQGNHATVLVARLPDRQAGMQDIAIAFAIWRPPHPGEEADLFASKSWPEYEICEEKHSASSYEMHMRHHSPHVSFQHPNNKKLHGDGLSSK